MTKIACSDTTLMTGGTGSWGQLVTTWIEANSRSALANGDRPDVMPA